MFSSLGWLESSGNLSQATAAQFQADLASLPANRTAGWEENVQQCRKGKMEKLAGFEKICVEDGKGNYSEEELARLDQLAFYSNSIECFVSLALDTCREVVGEMVYGALYSSLLAPHKE